MSKPAPLRFIALHGHAMTGDVFEKRTGSIRSDVKKLGVTFCCPDGPLDAPQNAYSQSSRTDASSAAAAGAAAAPPNAAGDDKKGDTAANNETPTPTATTTTPPPSKSWFDFWTSLNVAAAANRSNTTATTTTTTTTTTTGDIDRNSNETDTSPITARNLYGMAASVKSLASSAADSSSSSNGGPSSSDSGNTFDGLFAFSQGCGMAALWTALALQEVRKLNVKRLPPVTEVVADDAVPPTEWRLPLSMVFLLGQPQQEGEGEAAISCCRRPFSLVNVSGQLPQDVTYGPFIRDQFQQASELYGSTSSSSAPLRKLHLLHVYGNTDTIVPPQRSSILASLYDDLLGPSVVADKETWIHEGGHGVPSQLRKPFKALVEKVVANSSK